MQVTDVSELPEVHDTKAPVSEQSEQVVEIPLANLARVSGGMMPMMLF